MVRTIGSVAMITVVARSVATSWERVASSRSGLVTTAAFYLMVTGVLAALWRAAADANGGAVAGYGATALVWYVATSEVVTIPLSQRLIEEIGDDVRSGAVETELLRPGSLLVVRVASQIGTVGARLGACMATGVVFCLLLVGAPPSGTAAALAVPSIAAALLLNIIAQHACGAVSFWLHDATAAWFLYQKLVFVLGGMLIPLEVLPSGMEAVARWLPFSAMAYAPARFASGHADVELLAIQLGWIVVAAIAARAAFVAGLRRRSMAPR